MAEVSVSDPATIFRFEVNAGFNAGFAKVTGLKDEQEVAEYREGTDPIVTRKQPGLRTAVPVVCERGVGPGSEMKAWRDAVIKCENYKRPVSIMVKYCDGKVARTVHLSRAWPHTLDISDLDARSSEIAVERMELVHEGLDFA